MRISVYGDEISFSYPLTYAATDFHQFFFFLSFSDFYHMILFLLYENYSNLLVCIFSIEKNSFENSDKFYEVADICVTKVSYCHTDIELYYESKSEA